MELTEIISSLRKIRNEHESEIRRLSSEIQYLNEENDDLRIENTGYERHINDQLDEGSYADQYDAIDQLYYNKLALSPSQFEYELDQFFRKILNKRVK